MSSSFFRRIAAVLFGTVSVAVVFSLAPSLLPMCCGILFFLFPLSCRAEETGKRPFTGRQAQDAADSMIFFENITPPLAAPVAASAPEALLQTFAEAKEGLIVLNDTRDIVVCSPAAMKFFGLQENPTGKKFAEVFSREASKRDARPYCEKFHRDIMYTERILSSEIFIEHPDKTVRCLLMLFAHILDGTSHIFCLLKNLADFGLPSAATATGGENEELERNRELIRVNAQLRIENAERSAVAQALRRAEARYRDIFDNATEGIFQWTPDWRFLSANLSMARMLGFSTVSSLLDRVAEGPYHFCRNAEVEQDLVAALESLDKVTNYEFEILRQDGMPVWAGMNARRVTDSQGATIYYEAFVENITSRKMTEEKLLHQAFHDPLTGLANRALFHDRLKMAMRRAGRHSDLSYAVLYLDLDRFKIVNDSFGHNTGDAVLCRAAAAILSCVRDVDTVARFGGDEFAVLLEGSPESPLAVKVARRIHAVLNEPVHINDQEITVGASIGIVLRAEQYTQPEDILRDADTAMYRAKARRNSFKVFSQKMREETMEIISLEADLRQSVKNDEFFVEYQPIVNMRDNSLHGYEALLRWHRRGVVVSPGTFIPVAEETGLVRQVGIHMIEKVCFRIAGWTKKYAVPFAVHLNISGKQLLHPGFPREVQRVLERTKVNPDYLRFEITESVLLDNVTACLSNIRQIRDLGVRFCLDDFGTGFSSLNYLRRLPLDSLKVDRSFITDIETDEHAAAIVRTIVRLGEDLGLSVVVEGIERPQQLSILQSLGCTLAQGFYFHRPLDEDKAELLLQQ